MANNQRNRTFDYHTWIGDALSSEEWREIVALYQAIAGPSSDLLASCKRTQNGWLLVSVPGLDDKLLLEEDHRADVLRQIQNRHMDGLDVEAFESMNAADEMDRDRYGDDEDE